MKTIYMRHFDSLFLEHIYQYFYDNISCLLYIVEVLPYQTAYFPNYFSLVRDIAESYGSWVSLIFIILSTLVVVISAQRVIEKSLFTKKLSYKDINNTNENPVNSTHLDHFFKTIHLTGGYFFRK